MSKERQYDVKNFGQTLTSLEISRLMLRKGKGKIVTTLECMRFERKTRIKVHGATEVTNVGTKIPYATIAAKRSILRELAEKKERAVITDLKRIITIFTGHEYYDVIFSR